MGYLQKEGVRTNHDTPKTILDRNSAYKLRTKTAEFPKLRTFKVRTPTYVETIENNNRICLDHVQIVVLLGLGP